MAKPIIIVGGSKGGVGKSMVCSALIHWLMSDGQRVLLVETDTSNPDVAKMYETVVETECVNLDDIDGWMRLVNICDQNPDALVVVNTAARNNQGVAKYGEMLRGSLPDLDRSLTTYWVINRQKDSLVLLKSYMAAIPAGSLHVVRNGYFGAEEKFETYNGSNIRKEVEGAGGLSLTFPDLADRVADALYSERKNIAQGLDSFRLGEKMELRRWVSATKEMFDQVKIDA